MTQTTPTDPITAATHLRAPVRVDIQQRFAPSDEALLVDVARHPWVDRLLRNRRFQFALILPNQIIFWLVIVLGLLGTADPGLNFATAITWYIWFCLVFVLMVTVGRGWCAMCPFGGFGEWVQRHTFWRRTQRALGLGWKLPESWAGYGFLISAAAFVLLTYIEEFFNIAGPGTPADTSWMVVGIVTSALVFFLLFERRTFCRYVCPLSSLIGSVGSMGAVAGFRTRDRDVCLTCATKECMRGSEDAFGCPWYTWPGSADSNLSCGLCTECYKACPSGNVGLFLQTPLASVVAPKRRRADVAWVVAVLWGLVIYQQVNALSGYATIDSWLNVHTGFPHYPNPVGYLGVIAVVAVAMMGIAAGMGRVLGRTTTVADNRASGLPVVAAEAYHAGPGSFMTRTSRARTYFLPLMYALIPVVGADYFARQLPKFLKHASRIVPSVGNLFGAGSTSSRLYNLRLLSDPHIVAVQIAVMIVGTLASAWAGWRITNRELVGVSRGAATVRASVLVVVLACGLAASLLYVAMHAAS
ncbi:MAG: 4Fe-4S binding protein [Actinomycetes bacterium]